MVKPGVYLGPTDISTVPIRRILAFRRDADPSPCSKCVVFPICNFICDDTDSYINLNYPLDRYVDIMMVRTSFINPCVDAIYKGP
jgi:hypothetical protein